MKKFKLFSLLLLLIVGGSVLEGCDNKGKVIAVVNGDNIYESDFNNMVKALYAVQGTETTEEYKRQVFDSLITLKLVEQECKSLNISVADKDVTEYITSMAQTDGLSKSKFYKQLKEDFGYSKGFVKSLVKSFLYEDALHNYVTESVAALDEAGYKALYDAEPGKYKRVQVSHILIKVATDAGDATAKAKALDLISQLNSGADFATLAKANSEDDSAIYGGVLGGYITRDDTTYVAEFVQGAMSLTSTGDYTKEPVKTQYGYHIIKIDSLLASYDELKDDIKSTIDNANKKQAYDIYINSLREKAQIEEKMSFGNQFLIF